MLTATYNIPACEWTQAVDDGLAMWSPYVVGDACFKIRIEFDEAMTSLARCYHLNSPIIGRFNGAEVKISGAMARLQGLESASGFDDFQIVWNRSFPWHHGQGTMPGRYTSRRTAAHEIGHALYMLSGSGGAQSPFTIWKAQQPQGLITPTDHVTRQDSIMFASSSPGQDGTITSFDIEAAGQCGVPTTGNSKVYIAPGGVADGGPGANTAIWLQSFNAFDATLRNFSSLEMRGPTPLTYQQADLYRLYKAAFGRPPDLPGFRWWLNVYSPIHDKAVAFASTDEFRGRYESLTHSQYIEALYVNILGRQPDAAGLAYWVSRTDLERWQLLLYFALSPENEIRIVSFTL